MKKITAILFFVILAAALSLAGCSDNNTFTEKSYASGDEPIEKISIDVADRELEVSASEDDRVHIDYFDSETEFLHITVTEGNELLVKLEYNKNWTDFIGVKPSGEYRKIQIRVPDNLISAFSATTTNENIQLSPLSFTDNISLNANGGDIVCEKINAGKSISLTAKNGNIRGSVLGGMDDFSITCTIKKGKSNLPAQKEGGVKTLSADCNNGDINVEFIKQPSSTEQSVAE